MTTPCQKEDVIDIIREDVREIKGDIKEILAFKFQILGGIMLGSLAVGFIFNLVMYEITKK